MREGPAPPSSLASKRPRLPAFQVGLGVALLALMLLAGVGLLASAGALVWEAGAGVELAALAGLLIAVRAMGVARGVLRYLERLISHDATFRLLERVRVWFHERLVAAGPVAVGRLHSADLLDRVVADVELLQELHLRVVAPAAAAALVAVTVTGVLLWVDPWSAGVVFALLLAAGVLVPALAQRAGRAPARRQAAARRALRRGVIEGLGAWREAALFGRGEAVRTAMMKEVEALGGVEEEDAIALGVDTALHQLIVGAAAVSLLVRAAMLLGEGALSPTVAAAMVFGVLVVFEAVQSLPEAFRHLERSRSALRRLESDASDLHAPGRTVAPANEAPGDAHGGPPLADPSAVTAKVSGPVPAPLAAPAPFFEVRDFGVEGLQEEKRPRLQGLSFRLAPGERLVVTGPSGSGKSTLVRGLVGLEPHRGTLCSAHPTAAPSVGDFGDTLSARGGSPAPQGGAGAPEGVVSAPHRARFAVLPQEVHLMRAPLAENLRVADPGASDELLREVLHEVGLAPVLAAMPDGLATELEEAGSRLSGGERRRIGLARLLLRVRRTPGPMVLLLDEPTAHLDGDAAVAVWALLDRLRAEHAQLIVSHRPLPLQPGDRVLALADGRAVEQGDAQQLLAAGGAFAALRAHQEGELRFENALQSPHHRIAD